MNLKALLNDFASRKNTQKELFSYPDPLQIASVYKDETIALICALFAYGNAKNIVNFLNKLDFDLLQESEQNIIKKCQNLKYRFQNSLDIAQIFITLKRLQNEDSIENIFTKAYKKNQNIIDAISYFINTIYKINSYRSYGYEFFFSKKFKKPTSTLKRYNMYLRWMVRKDELDLGIFKSIQKKDLLIPLDTHTHKISLKLKLLKRQTYDFKSVLELTHNLKKIDPNDPIKYDFALYRIGQNKEAIWSLN
ncbi:TIGR02757 family protein [Campylobacter insulaenigrae]|uniref:TIGR02757 family protein n=1 Tax=Campylobacter insulaenigrae TaxID=260714 RepID=UPI0021536D89|nr:TIGR02757 family protein [Campylobacter insulaenigrae]MCR6582630.1 TIGR02757 family protein [Campylobacter insulaenigrae]MCR6587952.1 TIGR02757 family protein [Campylobacter insulaenigrae]